MQIQSGNHFDRNVTI